MKPILFIDTETTDKWRFNLPATDPKQPHMVQLAAMLISDEKKVLARFSTLIRPDGWKISEEAAAVHGITAELCEDCGITLKMAMWTLGEIARGAGLLVAHNLDFDRSVVTAEYVRIGMSMFDLPGFCTMLEATPVCKLPGSRGDYKWPKLTEAHRHLTGKDFDGAHDAMADVSACVRCYFALRELQGVVEAK